MLKLLKSFEKIKGSEQKYLSEFAQIFEVLFANFALFAGFTSKKYERRENNLKIEVTHKLQFTNLANFNYLLCIMLREDVEHRKY